MELQTPPPNEIKTTLTRNCEECGNEFHPATVRGKFCSDRCRGVWNKKHGKKTVSHVQPNAEGEEPMTSPVPSPKTNLIIPNLPPQATYIIHHLENERKRWEDLWKEERAARKELKKKYERIKEEKSQMETQHRLDGIEDQKPSWWEKFMGSLSSIPEPISNQIGAALGKLTEMVIPDPSVPQISGTEGQLDEAVQKQLQGIQQWFVVLPSGHQAAVYNILDSLAKVQQPEKLNMTLTRIQNILKNGTTMYPQAANS